MKKRLLAMLLALGLMTVCGCAQKKAPLEEISEKCGIDLTQAEVLTETDTYDSIHRDGFTYLVLQSDSDTGKSIQKNLGHWKVLPFEGKIKEFVSLHEWFPKPQNGYYWFYDRHEKSTNPYDSSAFLERSDYKFTLVLYDSDTSKIYVFQIDT